MNEEEVIEEANKHGFCVFKGFPQEYIKKSLVEKTINEQMALCEKYRGLDAMNDLGIQGELSGLASLKQKLGLATTNPKR